MDEAFYTDILDAMSDGVMVFGHDKRITFCNQAFFDTTGFNRGDFDHAFCSLIEGVDTDPKAIAAINSSLAKGAPFDGEILSYRKSGESFWNQFVIKPVTNTMGSVTHFIGIVRDVTANITHYSGHERDYEFIFENVLAGIIIHHPDSRVRFINRKAREMLGLTGNAAIDKAAEDSGWQFLRPDGSTMPLEELPAFRALHENTTVRGVLLGRKHPLDGNIVWAICDAFVAKNDEGEVTVVLVSFSDVSRLIESEKSAEAYRERFELAARASQDVIFEWNIETGAFSANEAFKNVYGYDPPTIMGPDNLDPRNTTENGKHAVRDITLEAIASGTDRFSVDHMVNRPDGSTGHIVVRAFIVRNPRGEAKRVIGTATDIGVLTSALASLEESETRFRIIADTVSDILWDRDLEAGTVWATPGWPERLGIKLNQNVQNPLAVHNYVHPDDRDQLQQSFVEALKSGAAEWDAEFGLIGSDGARIILAVSAAILRHPNGRVYRMLGNARNVTIEKRQQEGYSRARALEAVGQLTGGVAHDFNNQLMIIQGNAELLEMSELDEDEKVSVDLINQACRSAADLTRRLLAFSRQSHLQTGRVDLTRLISSTVALLRAGIPKSITIQCKVSADIWQAKADANALEQAIVNLAVNARDAMPDGGDIVIGCENRTMSSDILPFEPKLEPGDYVLVSVTDNGAGMSPDVLARAFEPFFTTKEVGKGTGLGLSTVYGFATQSDGHVTIDSEPGQGTAVKLFLPRFIEAGAEEEQATETKMVRPGNGQRILLVEDQPDLRSHVEKVLTKMGYLVTAAEHGKEALSLIDRGMKFDLLFTDVIMPGGINGQQLAEEVRKLDPRMKVLFTSGYPAFAFEHLMLDEIDSIRLLKKPYRSTELAAILAELFEF